MQTDTQGYVKVKPGTPETNVDGVFAAGDVQDTEWRQVCVVKKSSFFSFLPFVFLFPSDKKADNRVLMGYQVWLGGGWAGKKTSLVFQ